MTKIKAFYDSASGRQLLPGAGVETPEQLLLNPIAFMTKPTHYDPDPKRRIETMGIIDNSIRRATIEDFDPDRAEMQQIKLRAPMHLAGSTIILDEGHPDQFDGVYNADPSISTLRLKIERGKIKGVHIDTIASNFYNISRKGEVARQLASISFLKRYLQVTFGISVTSSVHIPKLHGEGTGDNVYDPYRDIFFCGYKPKSEKFDPTQGRSDPDFHKIIEMQFKMQGQTFPFEVYNGHYHGDTVLGPLQNGDVVVHPGGMSGESFKQLEQLVAADQKQLIVVSAEDARNFATNLICMNGNEVITPKTSSEFSKKLHNAGYKHTQVDLSQFVDHSSGGAHCLQNTIILRRDERKEHLSFWITRVKE